MTDRVEAVGAPTARIDARVKVTGAATYTADHQLPNTAYAALVQSTIARGRVLDVDARAARAYPGVLLVISADDAPPLAPVLLEGDLLFGADTGEERAPLQDARVHHQGQVIAVVVAESLEIARHAAALVEATYAEEPAAIDLEQGAPEAIEPEDFWGEPLQIRRGNLEAIDGEPVRVAQTYETARQHHHPIEPHATIASWHGERLTVYEASQWIMGARKVYADSLGIPEHDVRVLSRYVGGGFGSKGPTWRHGVLAAVAARRIGRPVKLVLSRQQMNDLVGHRPRTRQHVELGAMADGALVGIRHRTATETSRVALYVEGCGTATPHMYACPNLDVRHRVIPLDLSSPNHMRTPGEAPGTFALECAMDELAEAVGIDPLELRIRNHATVDPQSGRPWSTNHLLRCYESGARHIGWPDRNAESASLIDGAERIGYGVATAAFPGERSPACVRIRIEADGTAVVSAAVAHMGTGSATVMRQVAADALELPLDRVRVEIGDSDLPPAPGSYAAQTTASISAAIEATARLAIQERVRGGRPVEVEGTAVEREHHAVCRSFGAVFARVRVDALLGTIRVDHLVGVFDVGRVVNPVTARSQLIGGMIFGLGMALMEETALDPHTGRWVSRGLADYQVAVNADVPRVEAFTVGGPDEPIGSVGARGAGEIGNSGTAAAIANAVYSATGRRVRSLPIKPSDLVTAEVPAR